VVKWHSELVNESRSFMYLKLSYTVHSSLLCLLNDASSNELESK
jgi:hypothetical protein